MPQERLFQKGVQGADQKGMVWRQIHGATFPSRSPKAPAATCDCAARAHREGVGAEAMLRAVLEVRVQAQVLRCGLAPGAVQVP